jgi:hypothetical protein
MPRPRPAGRTGDSGTTSAHLGHDVLGFPSVGMAWPTGLNPARTAPSTCPRSRTTCSRRHNTVASARVRASIRLTRKPADQPDLGATASRVSTRRSGTDRFLFVTRVPATGWLTALCDQRLSRTGTWLLVAGSGSLALARARSGAPAGGGQVACAQQVTADAGVQIRPPGSGCQAAPGPGISTASSRVPDGGVLHCRRGSRFAPSQVNSRGTVPPARSGLVAVSGERSL